MRQLFTCLAVVLLFVADLPTAFAAPSGGQSLGYYIPPASYPLYFADQIVGHLTDRVSDSQVASVSPFPIRFHLSDPIA